MTHLPFLTMMTFRRSSASLTATACWLLLLLLSSCAPNANAFATSLSPRSTPSATKLHQSSRYAASDEVGSSYLMEEFKTAQGEVLNPYRVLKVSRKASRSEIKQAYRNLSRRYHPDGVRHRDLLPGSCNNLDDVRDHWERIRMSYEILSNPRLRTRYDRNEALADPGAAVRRAAVGAAFEGVKGVGEGLFTVGSFAIRQLTKKDDPDSEAIMNHKRTA